MPSLTHDCNDMALGYSGYPSTVLDIKHKWFLEIEKKAEPKDPKNCQINIFNNKKIQTSIAEILVVCVKFLHRVIQTTQINDSTSFDINVTAV